MLGQGRVLCHWAYTDEQEMAPAIKGFLWEEQVIKNRCDEALHCGIMLSHMYRMSGGATRGSRKGLLEEMPRQEEAVLKTGGGQGTLGRRTGVSRHAEAGSVISPHRRLGCLEHGSARQARSRGSHERPWTALEG